MPDYSLDGPWELLLDPAGIGEPWGQYQLPVHDYPNFINDRRTLNYRPVTVPGTWATLPGMKWYRELAWFIRRFEWQPRKTERVFLRFNAVNYRARVWLNGTFLGEHEGGYTPFEYEATAGLKAGENTLAVKVDPRPGPDSTIPIPGWACYPGIIRSVSLYTMPAVRWADLRLEAVPDLRTGAGRLTLRGRLDGPPPPGAALRLVLRDPDGATAAEVRRPLRRAAARIKLPVKDVRLWSPDAPRLYTVELALETSGGVQTVARRVGFRVFDVRPDGFFLNGRRIFLQGAGLHAIYPGLGHTIPESQYRRDYARMKQAGMNAVRLVHYPHDEAALDAADELGLLVWEEIPLYWQARKERARTARSALQQLRELILRDRHHPCVFAWGLGNEIPTGGAANVRFFERARALAARLDPGRPASFIDDHGIPEAGNRALRQADFTSCNLYKGWYDPRLDTLNEAMDTIAARFPGKPILVTEFGAGAVRGHGGGAQVPWSEAYQARVLEANIRCFQRHPRVGGCFIWCWADFEDPTRLDNLFERGVNNKGLLDAARHPKAAYARVARLFAGPPRRAPTPKGA